MLFLTFFIGLLAILISWKEIKVNTGFLPFQYSLDPIRNYRSISFNRPVSILFLLGSDAYPDVFPYWDLGT